MGTGPFFPKWSNLTRLLRRGVYPAPRCGDHPRLKSGDTIYVWEFQSCHWKHCSNFHFAIRHNHLFSDDGDFNISHSCKNGFHSWRNHSRSIKNGLHSDGNNCILTGIYSIPPGIRLIPTGTHSIPGGIIPILTGTEHILTGMVSFLQEFPSFLREWNPFLPA